jgi:spore germination protein YaaH
MLKSKTVCFAARTIFVLIIGYFSLSGFTEKKYAATTKTNTRLNYSYEPADTLPGSLKYKSYDTLPFRYKNLKQKDSSLSLLKRLVNVFKFKKFSNFNESNRVIGLLNQLHIGDSIVATQQNVAFLNKYLSDTVNQNIDSLYTLIYFLQKSNEDLYNDISNIEFAQDSLQSMQGSLTKRLALMDKYTEEYTKIGLDKYANRMVSDKELNILASKIFPIISVSTDIKKAAEKMARISMLKNIRDSLAIVREGVDAATGAKKYFRIRAKNKIEVYGFYKYNSKGLIETGNLGYLNTLIFSSLYINSKNGDIKDLNGWDTSSIVRMAQTAGCQVALTFAIENPSNVDAFLSSTNAQANFIKTAIYLMKFRNANMINISFSNFQPANVDQFTNFVRQLNTTLKHDNTDYKLLITVPALIAGNYYDLPKLAGITDRIIIDFSNNYHTTYLAPAAPLAGLPSLQQTVAFFINSKVLADQIVVCLPYHGAKWATTISTPDKFIEYINYATLRKNYQLFPGYINRLDATSVTSVMDSIGAKKDTLRRIYFDDESTLAFKYDFILKSSLRGVAVNALGEDLGYTGLWDEMSYAFAIPDTIFLNANTQKKLVKENDLSFFERAYRQLTLYNYILQNPCEICFENIKDSAKNELMQQYLLDLDIYEKMKAANAERLKNGESPYRSRFQYVNARLTHHVFIITVVLVLTLLILGIIYFLKTKSDGDRWKGRVSIRSMLLVNAILVVLFLFTFLFCNNNILFFGSAASDKEGYSRDYGGDNNAPGIIDSTTFDYCVKDPESDCINMPLHTLLGIIILGLVVGGILTRYLLLPMLKRYEKP